jgi:D-amino-acid dehydrogenase
MRVVVVGAGIVGVCTAWALVEAGCEVTVVERNRGVAQGASYGNAGMMAPSYVTPWAAPGMSRKVLSTLFARHAAVRLRPSADAALWRWIGRWIGECRAARFRQNKGRMQRLAYYSRDVMDELRPRFGLSYERTIGLLQLFRTERDAALAQVTMAFLSEAGIAHRRLSPDQCRTHEPGLSDIVFEGGLHLPDAEAGNCPLFARALRALCEEHGARFEFGIVAEAIRSDGDGIVMQLRGADGGDERRPDAIVIAAGVASASLLRRFGARLPLYPVKGYSASVAIREPTYAPLASVMDEAYRVAIVRLGNRIRVAGTAELGDRTPALDSRNAQRAFATLLKVARDWFPGAAPYQSASWWAGARPMLPDDVPVVGPTRHPRVFVNLGHGSTDWTMAAGAGRVVADVVMGRRPEIDLEGLTMARYG